MEKNSNLETHDDIKKFCRSLISEEITNNLWDNKHKTTMNIIGSKSTRSCNYELNGIFDKKADLGTESESHDNEIVNLSSDKYYSFLEKFETANFLNQRSTTQKATNADKDSKQINCHLDVSKLLLFHPNDDENGSSNNIDMNRFNELDVFSNRHQYYQFPLSHTFMNHFLKRHPRNHKLFMLSRQHRRDKQSQPIGASNISLTKKLEQAKLDSSCDVDYRASQKEFQPIITCIIENSLNLVSSYQNLQIIDDFMKVGSNDRKNQSHDEFPMSAELTESSENPGECKGTNSLFLEGAQCSNKQSHIRQQTSGNVNVCLSCVSDKNKDTTCVTENDNNSSDSNLEIDIDRASREANFDSVSQEIFLYVPSMSLQVSDTDSDVADSLVRSFDFVDENVAQNEDNASAMNNVNLFPEWLQQIMLVPNDEEIYHNEPHFYCQGDGFGVHPSTVALDLDEDDSLDSNTSSEQFTLAETDTNDEDTTEVPEEVAENNYSVIHQNDNDRDAWSDVEQWDDLSE